MSTDLEPIPELVARVDLAALVERYAGTGRQSGRTFTYLCPNPSHPDHHPSFTVSEGPGGWRWRCWSQCARGGDALDLVEWLEGLERGEAIVWLRRYLGDTPPASSRHLRAVQTPRPSRPELPEPTRPPADVAARLMAEYLARRGWPASAEGTAGLEVVLGPRGRPYIRHPFYGVGPAGEVELSGWQDRDHHHDPESGRAKWLAPAGWTPSLWGLPALEADTLAAVVVTEGPADGITAELALSGLEGVAVVGVPGVDGWRSSWAELLAGLRVVVAADADPAGDTLAGKLTADLAGLALEVVRAEMPAGVNDLGELCAREGLSAVRALLEQYLGDPAPPPPRGREEEATEAAPVAEVVELDWSQIDLFGDPLTPSASTPTPPPAAVLGKRCAACGHPAGSAELCPACARAEAGGPHRWRACADCGRLALAAVGRRCSLTPGCVGRYEASRVAVAA
jgi:hypothetical protein